MPVFVLQGGELFPQRLWNADRMRGHGDVYLYIFIYLNIYYFGPNYLQGLAGVPAATGGS